MPGSFHFNAADRAQLEDCGIPLAEGERQLALLTAVSYTHLTLPTSDLV